MVREKSPGEKSFMMGSAAPKRTCFMMKNFSAELKTQRREGRSSAADTVSFLRR